MKTSMKEKRIMDTRTIRNNKNGKVSLSGYESALLDSGADSIGISGKAWTILEETGRETAISDFNNTAVMRNRPIVTAAAAIDLPDDETIVIRVREAMNLRTEANMLLSTMQLRENGVTVHDVAKRHGGLQCIIVDDYIIPLWVENGMMTLK